MVSPNPLVVETTLEERGKRYGKFSGHASIAQSLKHVMRMYSGWSNLNSSQQEALEMIAHKIGRILNGDPNYADSWHDIAGYATLIDKQLNGQDIQVTYASPLLGWRQGKVKTMPIPNKMFLECFAFCAYILL